jgi:hypothetical protein
MKQPWEKYGISEASYLLTYTTGYNSTCLSNNLPKKNPYLPTSPLYKVWAKGRREAKRIY